MSFKNKCFSFLTCGEGPLNPLIISRVEPSSIIFLFPSCYYVWVVTVSMIIFLPAWNKFSNLPNNLFWSIRLVLIWTHTHFFLCFIFRRPKRLGMKHLLRIINHIHFECWEVQQIPGPVENIIIANWECGWTWFNRSGQQGLEIGQTLGYLTPKTTFATEVFCFDHSFVNYR